jgi:hypothetical protein
VILRRMVRLTYLIVLGQTYFECVRTKRCEVKPFAVVLGRSILAAENEQRKRFHRDARSKGSFLDALTLNDSQVQRLVIQAFPGSYFQA